MQIYNRQVETICFNLPKKDLGSYQKLGKFHKL